MQIGQEVWLPQWLYDGMPRAAVVLALLGLVFGPPDKVSVGMALIAGVYGLVVLITRRLYRDGGGYE